jgi:hypothetical protein
VNRPVAFPRLALDDIGLEVFGPVMDDVNAVGLSGLSSVPIASLPEPPSGMVFGSHAFDVDVVSMATGQPLATLAAPLRVTIGLDAAEFAAAGGDLHRAQLALRSTSGWLGLGCTPDDVARTLSCSAPYAGRFAVVIVPPPGSTLDWDVASGHVYKQANGFGGTGDVGYTVLDDADAAFWSELQRLGGVELVGYPISGRFTYAGYLTQAFQKLVLQWQPELGRAVPVNVFDELDQRGSNAWLEANREVPRPSLQSGDSGLEWPQVVERHTALLDPYRGLWDFYSASPDAVDRFGLPVGIHDYGSVVSVRLQRATLQLWQIDVPWAAAGSVVVGNGGDIGKEAGLWPLEAVTPGVVLQP